MKTFLQSAPMTDHSVPSNSSQGPPPHGSSTHDRRMSFGDHLEELRSCMIRAIVGLFLGMAICLYFGKTILVVICHPLLYVQYANGLTPHLQALAPSAVFTAYLKIGFMSGAILAMPWLLYQIWVFIASGLYSYEQRFVKRLIPASIVLFFSGVLFLYFIVLPIVLHFFISFNKNFPLNDLSPTSFQKLLLSAEEESDLPINMPDSFSFPILSEDPKEPLAGDAWVNVKSRRLMFQTPSGILSMPLEQWSQPVSMHSQFAIDFYISFVLMLALAFGVAFETPIVVFFLAWSGIVTTATMCRGRRYVVLGTIVAAAVLTPPDIISQLLLAIPMYLLFELGILVARLVERKTAADASG